MRVGMLISLILAVLIGCGGYQVKPGERLPCPKDGGVIFGCVTDSITGKPVWGGTVHLVGTRLGSMIDQNGIYRIGCIRPGRYILRFSSIEHITSDTPDIEIKKNDTVEVDWILSMRQVELMDALGGAEEAIQGTITDRENGELQAERPMTSVDSLLTRVMSTATDPGDVKIAHATYGNSEPIVVNLEPIEWPDNDDSTGMIFGTVTDNITGDPIMGVAVSLNGDTTGIFTTFQGEFRFAKLLPGSYQLKLEGLKYTTMMISNIEVRAGEVTRLAPVMREKALDIRLFAPHVVDTVDASKL